MANLTNNWKSFDLLNPTDEHKMLRDMVKSFVQAEVEPQAQQHDKAEKFNLELFKKLSGLGLLGITVPELYGGAGMDATAVVIVLEELSASDPGFCLAYLAHTLLAVNNLAVNGDLAQKKKYLPGLSDGSLIGAMAMSEPDYGTDVMGLKTAAVKQGEHYILNGRKMWITNGAIDDHKTPCDFVWVYAKTGEKQGRALISSFIVEKGDAGFYVGQKITGKLGMRASNTAELVFENCRIPAGRLVGQEGDSMHHMMRNLEIERIGLAAMGLGIARRSIEIMNKYAGQRTSFGKPLNSYGQIQKYIAESYAEFRSAQCYVYDTARRLNLTLDLTKEGKRLDSDGAKLVATTMSKNVADRAIQVLGGYGYVAEYHVERLWRDAKLLEIGGGTLEAHQKNITRDLAKLGF